MLSKTFIAWLSVAAAALAAPASQEVNAKASICSGSSFKKVSAADWIKNASPGWNLGNTLDAIPTEGSWNNPPVVPATFDQIKASGYKGVRLPVTWANHFVSGAPNYTVDSTWMQRVSDVVDMTVSRGLYTIVNVHHDASTWQDLTQPNANYTAIEQQFYQLWYQIGTELGCKSQLLAFEPINEPTGSTQQQFDELNKLNALFVKAINDAGGFNKDRVVTLVGPGEDSIKTSASFVAPANITNPWAIQFHYYSPYDFIFGAWGKTIWGSDADKAALEADLANIRGNFTNIPLVIGEWSASQTVPSDATPRWKYVDFLVQTARKYDIGTFVWDNGEDMLNRATGKWRDQVAQDLLISGSKGIADTLPDSQEDGSALTQYSYGYLYHRVGTPVADQTNSYLLNGNTIKGVSGPNGASLKRGTDYIVSGANVTFKASLLNQYISPTAAPGSKANFTIKFSKGASVTANLVQWDTAVLASNSSSAAAASGDLHIPVTYKGINRLAAVKATLPDGTCLFDTWTVYLPAIQQCRITYSGQWNWDDSSVILPAATVQAVKSSGQSVAFVFEFFPRMPGNSANYTLTV